ncbi:methyl-accepting chemotaxis protein [Aquabacter sp. CN5-332]|uniref:methyl-accepting chemotaxis protein n=1 Tax=Aquabacter sp. CN5-332 TaxID=3156608 RepID=UPI0032B4689F
MGGFVWDATSRMAALAEAYGGFAAREAQAVAGTRLMSRYIFVLDYAVLRMIAENNEDARDLADAQFDDILPQVQDLGRVLAEQAPAFADRISQVVGQVERFTTDVAAVRQLAIAGDRDRALAIMHGEIDPGFDRMVAASEKLGADIQAFMEERSATLAMETGQARLGLALASLFGIAAGILAVAGVSVFGISRPLGRLVDRLQKMADGDVDAEIREAARGDEIGAVGRAVEGIKAMVAAKAASEAQALQAADAAAASERRRAMVELADYFERTVGGIIGNVTTAANELQGTAQAMTAIASRAAGQSSTVAAAAAAAASNVNTVAAAAEELGSSALEIGRHASGSATLARTAADEATGTAASVRELGGVVTQINDIAAMIETIAGQTHLLALNATIEAAHAGEAGRGFAVVASEVKDLAHRTAGATKTIRELVERIQGSSGEAVSAIDVIATRIRDISSFAAIIAGAVEQQTAATQEIVANVSRAATGTSEVTSNIAGVAETAEVAGTSARQVLFSASALSGQSAHLSVEVDRFLSIVRAA